MSHPNTASNYRLARRPKPERSKTPSIFSCATMQEQMLCELDGGLMELLDMEENIEGREKYEIFFSRYCGVVVVNPWRVHIIEHD